MMQMRILPLVLIATGSLFLLKSAALLFNGGLSLQAIGPAVAQTSETPAAAPKAQDKTGTPAETKKKSGADAAAKKAAEGSKNASAGNSGKKLPVTPKGRLIRPGVDIVGSKAAVLERLGQRSKQLDARARELDLRENLLKATEKRLSAQLEELRAIKKTIEEAAKKKEEHKKAQLKGLVAMYENMKAKEAARIFNKIEMPVLIELVDQMNARKMSEILGKMDTKAAEQLTVELARRGRGETDEAATQLPKIQGKDPG